MTSHPDKPVGPSDIKNLLDLLAASEGSGTAQDVSGEMIDEHEPRYAQPIPQSFGVANRSAPDPAENPYAAHTTGRGPFQDEVENRFAAHIVQGMSKIKPR
jgi:hypothetical protein